jgi:crotonobetainyl-CoA:carnitine CoA-transferase CaiB-like acyl-CoA transferase
VSRDLLAGVRVLELSQFVAAPLCGLSLREMGADVVKVEPPHGEPTRSFPPLWEDGESGFFHMLNRGKRSLSLDLSAPAGRLLVERLIDTVDVVIESLGVAGGWLSAEEALGRNPGLIWCSVTGLGVSDRERAMDPTLQARMGLMALTGHRDGPPLRVPAPVVDLMTGAYATQEILGALLSRERDGRGAFLDCALLDAAAAVTAPIAVIALAGETPRRLGSESEFSVPSAVFATGDSRYVSVVALTHRHWVALCGALNRDRWSRDSRFASNERRLANRELLHGMIQELLLTRSAEHWAALITKAGGFCEVVREIDEAWRDPRLAARGLVGRLGGGGGGGGGHSHLVPALPFGGAARRAGLRELGPAPELGQHSREVASEAGLAPAEVDALLRSGVLGRAASG